MLVEPGNAYIGTLRAIGPVQDALALRIRLHGALSAIDLHPADLPASAIVFIRKLRAPLPRTLRFERDGVCPPSVWEQAVTVSIDQLIRGAARPALGPVPASAEAVVFLDQSEFLASLANDWCDGTATTRWWWQSLFKRTDSTRALIHAWVEAPEYIPAALERLAEGQRMIPFVRALDAGDARALVQAVTRRFGLHTLQSALDAVLDGGIRVVSREGRVQNTESLVAPSAWTSSVWTTPPGAPWQCWVPESAESGISLEPQCFLGIGLMLQRAPAVVRTPAFARAVLGWQQTASQHENGVATPSRDSSTQTRDPYQLAALVPQTEPRFMRQELPHAGPMEPERHVDASEGSPANAQGALARAESPLAAQSRPSSNPAVSPHPTASAVVPAGVQEQAHMRQPALAVERMPAVASLLEALIHTRLGGLFYLINLGLFLDLYGDFTTPAHSGIALPIWDFVALLGQQLVGEGLQHDPVWSLLARLAGRSEQEEPGRDFDPPDRWCVAPAWLAPFAHEGIWEWDAFGGRLRARHPAVFCVLDVPLDGDGPTQQLLRETRAWTDSAGLEWRRSSSAIDAEGDSPLQRWIGWLMPYVRARLQRALGLSAADDLPRVLCAHDARVLVTPTHLDVTCALDTLPIEIRLAGLDRDPGWVPAAGRYIAFHFE